MALDSILNIPVIPAPPKSAAKAPTTGSSSSGSSSGGSAASSSSSTTGADHSAGASAHGSAQGSGDAGHNSAKSSNSKSSSSSASQQPQGNAKTKQNAATQHAQQSSKAAANTPVKTVQTAKPTGQSFLDALAKTQADAATTTAAAAAPEIVTEPEAKAKKADDKDNGTDAPSPLTFIPQAVAAVIAQPTTPVATNANTNTPSNDDGDDAISIDASGGGASGSSSSTLQALTASLAKDTAETAKDTAATSFKAPEAPAPATDGSSNSTSTISAFQSHMSVSSHFQQVTAPDSSDNKISSPVGTSAFQDEVSGKITWMANQGIQSANLQLSPDHLGPVTVHISVTDGSASVAISAAHPDTRAALEQALPKLREMFSTNGLTLSDANVSHQSPRGQQQNKSVAAIGGVRGAGGPSDDSTSSSSVTTIRANVRGLVDTYA